MYNIVPGNIICPAILDNFIVHVNAMKATVDICINDVIYAVQLYSEYLYVAGLLIMGLRRSRSGRGTSNRGFAE